MLAIDTRSGRVVRIIKDAKFLKSTKECLVRLPSGERDIVSRLLIKVL